MAAAASPPVRSTAIVWRVAALTGHSVPKKRPASAHMRSYPRRGPLPGYLTAAARALPSGLSRSVAAAASADTMRSMAPPGPYLAS